MCLANDDLLLAMQNAEAVRPEQQECVNRRSGRLRDNERAVQVVVKDQHSIYAQQAEGVERVLQNVPTFVVTIDVGEVEPRRQQRQGSPGFRFQLANLARSSHLAKVGVKPPFRLKVRPGIDTSQRCVWMREKMLSDPESAAAFMAADFQTADRSPGQVAEVFLPEFGVRTVPVACEFQGSLPVQLNSARGR